MLPHAALIVTKPVGNREIRFRMHKQLTSPVLCSSVVQLRKTKAVWRLQNTAKPSRLLADDWPMGWLLWKTLPWLSLFDQSPGQCPQISATKAPIRKITKISSPHLTKHWAVLESSSGARLPDYCCSIHYQHRIEIWIVFIGSYLWSLVIRHQYT